MAREDPHAAESGVANGLPLTDIVKETKKDTSTRPALPDVKDKGYAWVVVLVMFISNVVTAGYIKSFGILYNALKVAYPNTSGATGGIIIALLSGFRSVLGECQFLRLCAVPPTNPLSPHSTIRRSSSCTVWLSPRDDVWSGDVCQCLVYFLLLVLHWTPGPYAGGHDG
ncbi:hypothetical protein FHG87_022353 [Trinorchestia longiramus]|nr:hypothetical protein FHG87_022353 [Trinorchestia longiramus]